MLLYVLVEHPQNQAMGEYRGRRAEDMVLNHLINRIVIEEKLGNRVNSLVTGKNYGINEFISAK